MKWFVSAFIETLNQLWTLLGMFIAWCVLEGSAKTVVGAAILFTLAMWLISIGIRERDWFADKVDEYVSPKDDDPYDF